MKDEIEKALKVIQDGGTIIYPTDTIWGLGCDATNAEAIDKVYSVKNRGKEKSLIILLDDDRNLKRYVREVPETAWDILDHADKPVTIVYPGAFNLPANLISDDGSIAIRIVKDEFAKRLIQRLKKPIVSTSANISGNTAAKEFKDISPEILKAVDHVVHLPTFDSENKQKKKQSSSIIKIELDGEIHILRN